MLAFYLTWSGAQSPPQPSINKAFIKGAIFKCLLQFLLYNFNALLAVKVFSTMIARHLHILKMTHFNVASNIFESSLFSTNLANAGEDIFSSTIAVFTIGNQGLTFPHQRIHPFFMFQFLFAILVICFVFLSLTLWHEVLSTKVASCSKMVGSYVFLYNSPSSFFSTSFAYEGVNWFVLSIRNHIFTFFPSSIQCLHHFSAIQKNHLKLRRYPRI